MRNGAGKSCFLMVILVMTLLNTRSAFAYLDPSTGSMVVSAIVGLFASIALAVKIYWHKIKAFFKRGRKQGGSPQNPAD